MGPTGLGQWAGPMRPGAGSGHVREPSVGTLAPSSLLPGHSYIRVLKYRA